MIDRYECRPVFLPSQKGRAGGEGEHVRQEVPGHVHRVDHEVAVLDPDVDMRSEDEVALGNLLKVLSETRVPREGCDLLLLPHRERVRPGGNDLEALLRDPSAHETPHAQNLLASFSDVLADAARRLHASLVELRLDLVARLLVALEDLGDERGQLAGLGVDDLILLLDAECE